MEEIRCCTRETCPAYRKTSNSQDEASAPSEYTNFCDCFSDTPRKRCRNRHFSMRDVYKNMENPEQFRETLSDMNIMTGNLLKCLKAAAGDGKLNERSQWCLQNVCNKIPSSSTEVSLAQVTTLAERFLRSLGEPSSPDRNKQRSRVLYRNCCQKRGDKLSSNSLEFVVPVKISLGNKKAKAAIQFPRKKLKKKRVDTRYCSCDEEEREIDIFHSCESFAPQTIQLQQLQETEAQATKLRALRKFESQAQKKRGLKKLETQEAQQYALKKIETQAVQPAELTKDQAQTTDEMFYSCQSFSSEIFCRVCHQSPCICEVPAICKLCCKKTNLCKCERIDTSHILLAVQSTSVCRLCKKSPGKCRCSKKKGYSKDPSIPLVSTQLLRSSDDICQIKPDMSQKLYQRICFKCGLKHDKCVCCLPRVIKTCKMCGKPIYKCVCEKPQTSGFGKSEPQCLLPTKEMGTKCLELLPVVNFCKKCGIVSDRCLCKSDFARKKEVDIPVTNDAFADHIFDNMIRSCSCRKQGQINPDLIAELCLICRKTSDQSEKSMLAASNTEFIPEICSCEKLLMHDLNFPSKICKKCSTPLHQGVSEKYEECMIDSTALFIPDVCSCEKLLQHDLESVPKICKVCWCELQKCGCERPHISKAPSATTSGNPCDICGLSRSKCSCGKASSIPKPFCKCDAKGTDLCTCEQVREICCLFGENKDICECGKTVLSTTPSKIAQAQKICQQCGMPLRKCPCKHAMQCKAILPPKTVLTADKANETSFLEIDSVSTIQDTKMTAEKASGTVFEEMGSASTLEEMYPPSKLKKTKPTPECKGESISVGQLINKVEMANRDEIPSRGATTGEGKMAIEYEMRKREEVSNKDEKATEGAVSSKGEISNKIENSKNGVISIEDEIIDGKIASKVGVTSKAEIPSNAEIPSKGEILRRRESPENELANEVKIPREDKEPIVHEMSSGAEIAKPVGKPSMEELPGKIERHPERGMRSLSQHPDICIWDIDPEGKQEPCKCGREHIDLEDLEDFEKSLAYNKDQESYETDHGRCACNIPKLSIKPAPPPKPPRKTYRLAFPQHKDLDICRKCRFEPSPLIDQDGRVFCPGNCGCCLCPWRPRATPSMEDALRHSKFKVCKCRERGTIFTEFAKIDSDCSQISYFDACPCREKAEAIHLRLYGFEMWDVNDTLLEKFRGNVVYLKDVKENVPLKGQSKKFFSTSASGAGARTAPRRERLGAPRSWEIMDAAGSGTKEIFPRIPSRENTMQIDIQRSWLVEGESESAIMGSVPSRDPRLDRSESWVEQQSRPLHGRPVIKREEDSTVTKAAPAQDRFPASTLHSTPGAEVPSKPIYQCMHCLKMLPPTDSTSISAPTSSTHCNGVKTHTSSSSALLEEFPVHFRLQLCPNGLKKRAKKQHLEMLPSPEALETQITRSSSSAEQYYSCVSSDESETDVPIEPCYIETLEPCEFPRQVSESERNLYILKLLHEVVHLINEDSPIREEAFRITNALKTSSVLDKEKSSQSSAASRLRAIPHPLEPPGVQHTPSTPAERQDYVCVEVKPPNVDLEHGGISPYETMGERLSPSSEDPCVSPKRTDICPEHGPIEKILKLSGLCICPKSADICPKHGPIENILKLADICICPKSPYICPKHGPIENILKLEDLCICPKSADICSERGPIEEVLEFEEDYCLCETISSIKQKTSEMTSASRQPSAGEEETTSAIETCKLQLAEEEQTSIITTSKQQSAEVEQTTSAITAGKRSSTVMEEITQLTSSRPRIDEATSTMKQSLIDEATSTMKPSLTGEEESNIVNEKPFDPCASYQEYALYELPIDLTETQPPVWGQKITVIDGEYFHGCCYDDISESEDIFPECGCDSDSETEKDKQEKSEKSTIDDGISEGVEKFEYEDSVPQQRSTPIEGISGYEEFIPIQRSILTDMISEALELEGETEERDTKPTTDLLYGEMSSELPPPSEEPSKGIHKILNCTCVPGECTCTDGSGAGDGRYIFEEYPYEFEYGVECEDYDEECELLKEMMDERRKKKKGKKEKCDCCHCRAIREGLDPSKCMQEPQGVKAQVEPSESPPEPPPGPPQKDLTLPLPESCNDNELKYFVDSLIVDLDAMEHARRKRQTQMDMCMPKPCSRRSFPVTITDVTDLGTSSLYVKWTIHDCTGIAGYEIYLDGYLTNRYYNCKHEAAVITSVDVTIPHKVALVAQPSNEDDVINMLCKQEQKTPSKCKSLPWKSDNKSSGETPSPPLGLWTPSIYMYDPADCKMSPPVMLEKM